jgi:hypothetical protein
VASFFVRSVIIWMNDLVVITLIFGNLICSVHRSSAKKPGSQAEDKAKLGMAIRRYSHNNHTFTQDADSPLRSPRRVESDPELSEIGDMMASAALSCHTPVRCKGHEFSSLSSITKKSVSFLEMVAVSECEEDMITGSMRFRSSLEPIQGAPFKPGRPSSQDGMMVQPVRQLSAVEALCDDDDDESQSGSSSSKKEDLWAAGPTYDAPHKPKRLSLTDSNLMPVPIPSIVRSDSICSEEGERPTEVSHQPASAPDDGCGQDDDPGHTATITQQTISPDPSHFTNDDKGAHLIQEPGSDSAQRPKELLYRILPCTKSKGSLALKLKSVIEDSAKTFDTSDSTHPARRMEHGPFV